MTSFVDAYIFWNTVFSNIKFPFSTFEICIGLIPSDLPLSDQLAFEVAQKVLTQQK